MNSNVHIRRILISTALLAMKAAAAARDLTAPNPAMAANSETEQDKLSGWLEITAVPLGVSLMGACIWGCIKHSAVWRSLTGQLDAPVEGGH